MRTLLRDLGTVSGVQSACIVRKGEVLASSFAESDAVAQAASLGFVRGIGDGLEQAGRGFEELLVELEGRSLMVVPVEKDFVLAMLAAPDANLQLLRVILGSSVRQLRRMHGIAEKAEAAPAAARPEAAPAPKPMPGAPAPAGRPQQPAAAPPSPPPPPSQQAAKTPPTGRPQPPPPPGRPASPPPPPLKGQQQAPPPRPVTGAPPPPAPQAAAPARPQQPAAAAPAPQASGIKPVAKPEPAPAAAKPADKDAEPVLPQVLALLTEYIGPVARVSFKRGVTRWRETSTPTVGTLGELAKILAADLSSDSEKKAFLDAVEKLRGG
ncbi:MAG: hypothetical protein ABR538_01605 [Candidatus Binatia bacterium]